MYRNILVPLDGSELAESVLPHVEAIAKGCRVKEIDLLKVIPHLTTSYMIKDQRYVEKLDEAVIGKERAETDVYLSKVRIGLEAKGLKVRTSVNLGDPATEITNHAETVGSDLIVMATHGRSGPSRWVYGSVAEKVLRASCVPVMMVRPPSCVAKA
jgi:nucleotide-binding universal stress UspA family protein